jgi:hypothetical protein
MKRLLLALSLLSFATGCPSSTAATCPSTSTAVGDFTLNLLLQPTAGQCRVAKAADGGAADGDVATAPAPQNATVCVGHNPDGGSDLVYLAVENRTLRDGPLDPGGALKFDPTTSTNISGTVCGCAIDINETITGIMHPATPGAFQIPPDGGLTPAIDFLDGGLVDSLAATGGNAAGCLCNLPCNLTYQMYGPHRQ